MPICRDRTTKALSDKGFNLVRYPRRNIMPLDVLAGVTSPLEWLGPLPVVWVGKMPIPQPESGAGPRFEFESSDEIKASIGIKILQGLIGSTGSGKGNAEIAISSTLSFSYEAPQQLSISLFEVAEYLQSGDLKLDNIAIKRYLDIDRAIDSHFYLITEILRSKKLLVRVSGSSSEAVTADAAAIQGLASGQAAVSNSRQGSTQVTFDGEDYVTFAFRAYELGFVNGEWVLIGAVDKTKFMSADGTACIFGTSPVAIH